MNSAWKKKNQFPAIEVQQSQLKSQAHGKGAAGNQDKQVASRQNIKYGNVKYVSAQPDNTN